MLHYLKPNWPAPNHVKAFTSLRFGGHSQGTYASFNLGKGTDDLESVLKNRQLLAEELGLPREPLWLNQVHGINLIEADTTTMKGHEADGSFTSKPGVVCTVLTADCLPLLFCNDQGTQVAAVHAGWRGLARGIIESTLQCLQAPPDQWMVWLGPAIGPTAFEVGHEVREQFLQQYPDSDVAFVAHAPGKWLADLFMLARQCLKKCGVTRIYGGEFCTYSDASRFYSYRRDQGKSGTMASLIWLDK